MTRTRIVGAFVISLLAIALAAHSSPAAQLAAKVPEVYTANVFGCTGGNMSPRCIGPAHRLEQRVSS
jgi:hypothetical protein